MNKPPRWYMRTTLCLHTYEELKELQKEPLDTAEKKQEMLNIIKRIFVAYWKILRDFLKEEGIIEYYPRKILPLAVQKGFIDKSELVWLDYIDTLNQLIYDTNIDLEAKKTEVIEKYLPRIEKLYNFIEDLSKKYNMNDYNIHDIDFLPKEKPNYNPSEIGISESSYSILMNFLKNNPDVEYVWLHGSRADGTARTQTDIDIIVDYPMDKFETLKTMMRMLRIPYRIDIANIHDEAQQDFICKVVSGAKIIYRKQDFISS